MGEKNDNSGNRGNNQGKKSVFTSKLGKQAVSLLLAKEELEKKNIELEEAMLEARKTDVIGPFREFHPAGLNLGKVQNIADQGKQNAACLFDVQRIPPYGLVLALTPWKPAGRRTERGSALP